MIFSKLSLIHVDYVMCFALAKGRWSTRTAKKRALRFSASLSLARMAYFRVSPEARTAQTQWPASSRAALFTRAKMDAIIVIAETFAIVL